MSSVIEELRSAPCSTPPLTTRVHQFSTPLVDVWRTVIHPNQPLKMHRHAHSRIVIPLMDAKITVRSESGSTKELIWKKGDAYMLEADPVNQLHVDINEGTEPIEVMVVQFKQEQYIIPPQ